MVRTEGEHYLWQGDQVTATFNDQWKLTSRFLYGPKVDQLLARETFDPATQQSTLNWVVTDHLGSVRALLQPGSLEVQRLRYDAFGKPVDSAAIPLIGFAGREWDADSGLYYNRARWYDATTGRFISDDPIGLEGGSNRPLYVNANPTHLTDPSGLIAPVVGYLLVAAIVDLAIYEGAKEYKAYTAMGVDAAPAFVLSALSNLPGSGSIFSVMEIAEGKSLRGTDFGRELGGWDYAFRGLGIALDVVVAGVAFRSVSRGVGASTKVASREAATIATTEAATGRIPLNVIEVRGANEMSKFPTDKQVIGLLKRLDPKLAEKLK